ncbi:hypothetical protein GTZ99_14760 [Novosphingobium sp. FSY-8]|uniref:SF3 helicase domain-containing protein n=1 Tax=Novosphingobium ovatum TaxID=1908523 RepID=A0ABW9XGY6_9SPHN|nr:DUF5906 domain-containing protein [Novosphingobium ovatum]NBC37814.1 hypothetical protein [Novosphingobium ovatum]
MPDTLHMLKDLFAHAAGEIRVFDEHNGSSISSNDWEEIAHFIDHAHDPRLDLVTSDGEAIGHFFWGSAESASPTPSASAAHGMIYLFDQEVVEGCRQGEHVFPWANIPKMSPTKFATGIALSTPSSKAEIRLSTGRSSREKPGKWKAKPGRFGQFTDLLLEHQEGLKDGPGFVQGECAGGTRKAAAMIANYVLGVDLDTGAPLEEVLQTIRNAGLEAVIYTTHSHMKDTSVINRDAFIKWADGKYDVGDIDGLREYLRVKKGILPMILSTLQILDEAQHTEDGVVILVQHNPIPKFRAVFPLHEPFVFAKRGGTQSDAINEWKERYAGFCTELGLQFDESCVDPARLFYFPRHAKGKPCGSWQIIGQPLDINQYERVKLRHGKNARKAVTANNPFAMAGEGEYEQANRFDTANGGHNLRRWAAKYAKRFEIEALLRDAQPGMIRDDRGSKAGVHISCPFEDEHSAFGGNGTFVVNASDALDEGRESGFVIHCTHNACSDRERLDFLKAMIDQELIDLEDITCTDYLFELDDDEEEEDFSFAANGSRPVNQHAPVVGSRSENVRNSSGAENASASNQVEHLEFFNEKLSIARKGGKTFILVEPDSPFGELQFADVTGTRNLYRNRTIAEEQKDGSVKLKPAFDAWLVSDEAKRYEDVRFAPDGAPSNVYNLFRGWSIQPRKGDWQLLRNHIFEQMCGRNEEYFEYVMTYLAHLIQCPGDKPGVALVITGKKGTGKSIIFDFIARILGPYLFKATNAKHITGAFNGHLEKALVLLCEEAFWAGDRSSEGTLKDLITGDKLPIEQKGLDARMAKNFTRVIMISNEQWVVPASLGDERRFAVFSFGDSRQGDTPYFQNMVDQMENGGCEAMLYDLLHFVPAKGWNSLRTPPKTVGLQNQVMESMSGIDRFMHDLIANGFNDCDESDDSYIELNEQVPTRVELITFRKALTVELRTAFQGDRAKVSIPKIQKAVGEWFNANVVTEKLPGRTNKSKIAIIPPLSEIREHIFRTKGCRIDQAGNKSLMDLAENVVSIAR